jgi:hypothetical protein
MAGAQTVSTMERSRTVFRLHFPYNLVTKNFRRYIRVERIEYERDWIDEQWVRLPNLKIERKMETIRLRLENEIPPETDEYRVFARKRNIEMKIRRQRELCFRPLTLDMWVRNLLIESEHHREMRRFCSFLEVINDKRATKINNDHDRVHWTTELIVQQYSEDDVHWMDSKDRADLLSVMNRITHKYRSNVYNYDL